MLLLQQNNQTILQRYSNIIEKCGGDVIHVRYIIMFYNAALTGLSLLC